MRLSCFFFRKSLYNLIKYLCPEQIREIGDAPVLEVLSRLGGWPVIEKDWKAPKKFSAELFGRLRGEYGESVIIELFVGADDKNSSVNIIQVLSMGVYTTRTLIKWISLLLLLSNSSLSVGPVGPCSPIPGLLPEGEQ